MSFDGQNRRNESFYASRRHHALLFLKGISKPVTVLGGSGNGVDTCEELEEAVGDDDGNICGSNTTLKPQNSTPLRSNEKFKGMSNVVQLKACSSDAFVSPITKRSSSSSTESQESLTLNFYSPDGKINAFTSILPSLMENTPYKTHRYESRILRETTVISISSALSSTDKKSIPEFFGYNGCYCQSRIFPCLHSSLREFTSMKYRKLYPLLLSGMNQTNDKIIDSTHSSLWSTLIPVEDSKKSLEKNLLVKFPLMEITLDDILKAISCIDNCVKSYKLPNSFKVYVVLNYERLIHHGFIQKANYKSSAATILLLLAKFFLDMKPEAIEQFLNHLCSLFGVNSCIIFSMELDLLFNLQFQLSLPQAVVDECCDEYGINRLPQSKNSFSLLNGKKGLFSS